MNHEAFAQRVGRRLEAVADRLDGQKRRLGIDGGASEITARAQELRVAAHLVREEAAAVSKDEERQVDPGAPPLETQI